MANQRLLWFSSLGSHQELLALLTTASFSTLFSWLPCLPFPLLFKGLLSLRPSLTYWAHWSPTLGPVLPALYAFLTSLHSASQGAPGCHCPVACHLYHTVPWVCLTLSLCLKSVHVNVAPPLCHCPCQQPAIILDCAFNPALEIVPSSNPFYWCSATFSSTPLNSLDLVALSPLSPSLASQPAPLPLLCSPVLSQGRKEGGVIFPKFKSDHTLCT